ncbi:Pentapeptide repeat [Crocosphaera watsonii WH 0003]|uniref:Pentapeptide repeat n=1 Tax=Crocosphaera watsonii WH 0003 TaxID=423471 RepID=G5JAB5_CROWT|nr:Pentapeptide repeat [Crocosphaera watsonii WH 0003]
MELKELLNKYNLGARKFHNIVLREADLTDINLSAVDFQGADLRQSRLGKSIFCQANFKKLT